MESKNAASLPKHYGTSVDGRKAILLSSLERLALALGMERRLPFKQIEIMADDLAYEWSYSLENLVDVLFDWRRGAVSGLSERELLRFPRTVQLLSVLRRSEHSIEQRVQVVGPQPSCMVH